jgi:hypothetical protein
MGAGGQEATLGRIQVPGVMAARKSAGPATSVGHFPVKAARKSAGPATSVGHEPRHSAPQLGAGGTQARSRRPWNTVNIISTRHRAHVHAVAVHAHVATLTCGFRGAEAADYAAASRPGTPSKTGAARARAIAGAISAAAPAAAASSAAASAAGGRRPRGCGSSDAGSNGGAPAAGAGACCGAVSAAGHRDQHHCR